jgi:hypothetical protein
MLKKQKLFLCMLLCLFPVMECTSNKSPMDTGRNIIQNGDFSQGLSGWNLFTQGECEACISVEEEELHIDIQAGGDEIYSLGVNQLGLTIEQHITYTVSFKAYCESDERNIYVKIGLARDPWTLYSELESFVINTEKKEYSFQFIMRNQTDENAHLEFQLGTSDIDVYLDDIKVLAGPFTEPEQAPADRPTTEMVHDSNGRLIQLSLSERVTLLENGELGLHYFPDQSVILVGRDPLQLLVTAGNSTYLLAGTDIQNLQVVDKVLEPGDEYSFDNGYAGIGGAYFHGDGEDAPLIAFYHAEDHQGMPYFPPDYMISGYYARVGAAISYDQGKTWEKLGFVITSSKIKEWSLGEWHLDRGAGIPGLVMDKNGEYLYLFYSEFSRVDGRGVQICLARAPVSPDPGGIPLNPWKKFYNGDFSEPGLGGLDTPVISALHLNESYAFLPSVTYSEELDQYIIVFNIYCWKEDTDNTGLEYNGIYIAFSNDCINWTEPYMLIRDWSVTVRGRSAAWQPTIIWDEDSSTQGWLVYAYSERFGSVDDDAGCPCYMVGKRISFVPMDINP